MQAQEALNEDALVDEQPPEIGDDLNDSDVENQAPINHIVDYMEDYMMDKNKEFDEKLLDESLTSLKEAHRTLALESTKKYKANVIRQISKMRSACRTHVVCVTDNDVPTCRVQVLISCGHQKEEDERREQVLHRKRGQES